MTPVDQKKLRAAFGRFLTGVTVVTTRDTEGAPVGFTANSFTSVSLDPPLLLVCPGKHLSRFDCFAHATHFGVSILAEGQQEISNLFASGKGDRFADCVWDAPVSDIPLIAGRAAGFTCEVAQQVPAGDHLIMIGRVIHHDDATLPGLGYGPDGYFTRVQEQAATRPSARRTVVYGLLQASDGIWLTARNTLPATEVRPDQSPMSALREDLRARAITARTKGVYSLWDDDTGTRHLVVRATVEGMVPDLHLVGISKLGQLPLNDPAQKSLLERFALEHAQQAYGFYYGDVHAGDVLPLPEGD